MGGGGGGVRMVTRIPEDISNRCIGLTCCYLVHHSYLTDTFAFMKSLFTLHSMLTTIARNR